MQVEILQTGSLNDSPLRESALAEYATEMIQALRRGYFQLQSESSVETSNSARRSSLIVAVPDYEPDRVMRFPASEPKLYYATWWRLITRKLYEQNIERIKSSAIMSVRSTSSASENHQLIV